MILVVYLFSYATHSTRVPESIVVEETEKQSLPELLSTFDFLKYGSQDKDNLELIPFERFEKVAKPDLSTKEKCDLFQYLLLSSESQWGPEDDAEYAPAAFDSAVFTARETKKKTEELIIAEKERIRKEHELRGESINDADLESAVLNFKPEIKKEDIETLREALRAKSTKIEDGKVERAQNVRIFGRCYFSEQYKDKPIVEEEISSFSDSACEFSEQKVFPYFSKKLPKYTRWNGKEYSSIPYIDNIIKNDETRKNKGDASLDLLPETAESTKCFTSSLHKSINGRGLVVLASDSYTDEAVRLIRVLRTLGNTYPIQIVHKGDLSKQNQESLLLAARGSAKKVLRKITKSELKKYASDGFPPQELWFVDVLGCIQDEYGPYFDGFVNKLLAYVFNLFDEVMLLDTDTVPLVPISTFFELEQYQKHGALFFRDRDGEELLWEFEARFWRKTLPNSRDEKAFGVPESTDWSLLNRYLGEYRKHYMEAGLVMMKRSTHFTGVLMTLELALWKYATHEKYWGDKEMFWLAQSLVGNENYYMNSHQAGAAGVLRKVEGRKAHEICATHPGHIWDGDDKTLLWINSGFQNCKKGTWESDSNNERFKKKGGNVKVDLKAFYEDFTRITGVIVPPVTNYLYVNNLYEPFYGWYKVNICNGYYWCGYDIVAGSDSQEDKGLLIEFDDKQKAYYEFMGRLWNS